MFAFVIKEFRHILRDRRTLMILFGMPVAQVLLFGFVLTNDIKDAPTAVIDQSKDHESLALTQRLLSSGYFKLVAEPSDVRELEQGFRKGAYKLALVFPPNFAREMGKNGDMALQVIGDASDPNAATTLANYVQAIVQSYLIERAGELKAPLVRAEVRMLYNPEMKSVFGFVPGVMTLILMLVAAMMTSITIAREKEMGTMEVLLVSPLRPIQIVLGKAAPYLALTIANALLVVLLGIFVFGMPMNGSAVLLALESALYMLVALSLGIFISTRAADQQQAMFMSALGLMMPTVLLSGFIFPRESMPWPLQKIGAAIPATWFNQIIKGVMIKGVGLETLWFQTLVLVFMAVVLIGLSVRNFKNKLE
jgi:ABC-type multidrug transport system, permease component